MMKASKPPKDERTQALAFIVRLKNEQSQTIRAMTALKIQPASRDDGLREVATFCGAHLLALARVCTVLCGFAALAQGRNLDSVINPTDRDYAGRFRASYHLGQVENRTDINEMLDFLRRNPSSDVISEDALASLKNNIADVLIAKKALAPTLLETFLTMYADENLGTLWHNYIVQKIPEICLQLDNDASLARGLQFLKVVAQDHKAGFLCEATIGLDRICSARPDLVSSSDLRVQTLSLLHAEDLAPSVKATALQILTRHDEVEARMYAIACLSSDAPIPLKASALAALGKAGKKEDSTLIEPYMRSSDVRLAEAARQSTKLLKHNQ